MYASSVATDRSIMLYLHPTAYTKLTVMIGSSHVGCVVAMNVPLVAACMIVCPPTGTDISVFLPCEVGFGVVTAAVSQ